MSISCRAVGRNIRQARTSLGFTQEKAAELANLSVQSYGRFERGERFPSLPQLAQIAAVLNTSMNALLSGSHDCMSTIPLSKTDHFGTVIGFLASGCSPQAKALMLDVCQSIAARDKHIYP